MLSLFLAIPLFTYGSDLIEAGAPEKGEQFLHSLLTADISLEMEQRILYNSGVAALDQEDPLKALSFFQSIGKDAGPLNPFVEKGISLALSKKPPTPFKPFPPASSPLSLKDVTAELSTLLANLTSLPFEDGEKTPEYAELKDGLGSILAKKKEWWASVTKRQEELLPKGCSIKHFEAIVNNLGEGTLFLEKAMKGFDRGAKPYATLYPTLQTALNLLTQAETDLQTDTGNNASLQAQTSESERFELLSEMFQKDRSPPPPIPKGALW